MKCHLSSDARQKIAGILLEHPRVTSASILDEDGPTGRTFTVAYITAKAQPMEPTESRSYPADRGKRINQWQTIFNHTYRWRDGDGDSAPNFAGWNSSYTNKPIPQPEMKEWLDETVDRITALRPERLLEIGCGIGLLVQALSPHFHVYRGTDISPVAIRRLREFVAGRPDLRHVELLEREAIDFDGLAPGTADLVVLNSVIQYFPDLDYLRTVLERAADVVVSGHIFIGDVRHLGLLPVFHASIQFHKAPPDADVGWLRRKIALAVAQERELVIDPRFFMELSQSIPRIAGAEVLLKRGKANNELTRYRYDVVLHVGEAGSAQNGCVPEWQAGDKAVADHVSRFKELRLPAVRIVDVPNFRVARDLALWQMIQSADEQQTIKDLRNSMSEFENTGTDPEIFWQLLDPKLYDICIGISQSSSQGRFDVALVDRRQWSGQPPLQRRHADLPGKMPTTLATDPVVAASMQQLGLDLGEMLRARLPEPLVPAAVLVVNQLPF